jgi:hypothetical protein
MKKALYWRILPSSCSQHPRVWALLYPTWWLSKMVPSRLPPSAMAGEEEEHRGCPGMARVSPGLRNEGGHLSPLPALLPFPLIHRHPSWPFHAPTFDSFQIQWVKLHWKQTITPTVKGRKHCLIAVLHQRQHINPSLTRQLKINKTQL